ncbi:hypothetical protein DAPPUDRAFT_247680 [Daphnia pulex]|uniref:Uncharacterized protein n=1 Tax=Daphnia pulex TaxID=6669 RepID=E9GSX3_DAPPU|nr:hypothetical protein DAPPUDRAFT_247680 [Daphnia pulex]|eukprot:EFX77509.1 hypothetical protein DAPPUDRAFT_247680 [Daphnia pulex]
MAKVYMNTLKCFLLFGLVLVHGPDATKGKGRGGGGYGMSYGGGGGYGGGGPKISNGGPPNLPVTQMQMQRRQGAPTHLVHRPCVSNPKN